MRIALLAAASLMLAAMPASADIDERPDNLEACLAAAQGITMEVNFCWHDEWERVEPLLAPAFDKAMSIAEEGQRAPLEQSQKDFIAYRESWCSAKSSFLGSGHNEYRVRCMITVTRERIKGLEGFDMP